MPKMADQFFEVGNRRYYGNKTPILKFIKNVFDKEIGNCKNFLDLFAGTGAVSNFFNGECEKIIANDILFHNYCALNTWLKSDNISISKVGKIINRLNKIKGREGYVTKNFSKTFFTRENAMKIDAVRENIERLFKNKEINLKEKYLLITSLIYAVDKVANIITQYEAYLKEFNPKLFKDGKQVTYHGAMKQLVLKVPKIKGKKNCLNEVYNEDANEIISKLKDIDVVYIDPPYTSRQYCENYHILENIAEWKKPLLFGKAKKMRRPDLKSDYSSKRKVESAFKELISKINAKFILISYNNNGLMTHEQIFNILSAKGKCKIYEKDYNGAHICTSKIRDNKEKLFVCKVNK